MRLERVSQRGYAKRLGVSNQAVADAVTKGLIKKGWDSKEKKIIVQHADAEWGDAKRRDDPGALDATPVAQENYTEEQKTKEKSLAGSAYGEIRQNIKFAEAARIEKVHKARLAKMEADEREGVLVLKADVNKQLQTAGIELRKEIERLPARCIDAVRAAKTRTEGIVAMEDEVMRTLENVVKIMDELLGENDNKH